MMLVVWSIEPVSPFQIDPRIDEVSELCVIRCYKMMVVHSGNWGLTYGIDVQAVGTVLISKR